MARQKRSVQISLAYVDYGTRDVNELLAALLGQHIHQLRQHMREGPGMDVVNAAMRTTEDV